MSFRVRQVAWVMLAIVSIAALAFMFTKEAGLKIGMLRAESGLYLEGAQTTGEDRSEFEEKYVLQSYGGHYAPLALMLELKQAEVFGVSTGSWNWRQMIALGVLGTSIGWLVFKVGRSQGLGRLAPVAGAGVALMYIFQPSIIEMAMWPFMVLQFACIALAACSASFFVAFTQSNRESDFARFLLCAYATMHAFGVGASFSMAALGMGFLTAVLLFEMGVDSVKAFLRKAGWLALAATLTAGHMYMMTRLSEPEASEAVTTSTSVMRFGYLFMESIFSAVRSLWANGGYTWPRMDVIGPQAVYGLALFGVMVVAVVSIGLRFRRTRESRDLIAFGLSGSALLGLSAYIVMVVYRIRFDHNDMAVVPFVIGGRYVIFPTYFLILATAGMFACAAQGFGKLLAVVAAMSGVGATVASYVFFVSSGAAIWPGMYIDQRKAWNEAVQLSRNSIAEGQPVKNIDLQQLDPGFKSDLKLRRRLLEKALGCQKCVRFVGE